MKIVASLYAEDAARRRYCWRRWWRKAFSGGAAQAPSPVAWDQSAKSPRTKKTDLNANDRRRVAPRSSLKNCFE